MPCKYIKFLGNSLCSHTYKFSIVGLAVNVNMASAEQLEYQQPSDGSFHFHENCVVPDSKEVKTIRCSSELFVEKFSYTWKLYDFDKIPFINNYPIASPVFYINRQNDCRWRIMMTKHTCLYEDGLDEGDYVSGSSDGEEESLNTSDIDKSKDEKIKRIGFRLAKYDNTCDVWDTVRYSFTLKFSDGTTVSTREREDPGVYGSEVLSPPRYSFFTENDLENGKLFNEKYLEVTCNVIYKYVAGGAKLSPVNYDGKRFVEDLRILYVSNRHHDILFRVNGEFYGVAHKIVLQAAFPSFEKVFGDKDVPKLKFDLKVDSEVGLAMVNFIYSGKIKDGFPLEKCVDLHEAAKLYGVDCLEQYTSEYFVKNLDSGTCRECLGITDGLVDCLRSVKKLGAEKVKCILAKQDCSH